MIPFLSQVAGGYTEEYEGGLNFVTVRLAGQQVPKDQPAKAFVMIKHFLDGTPLPLITGWKLKNIYYWQSTYINNSILSYFMFFVIYVAHWTINV